MLAHLSVAANLLPGIGVPLGVIAAFILWLFNRGRSPRAAFHALQSLLYQLLWTVLVIAGAMVLGLAASAIAGMVNPFLLRTAVYVFWAALPPLFMVRSLALAAHGLYSAFAISRDRNPRYPIVASLIDARRNFS